VPRDARAVRAGLGAVPAPPKRPRIARARSARRSPARSSRPGAAALVTAAAA